MNGDAEITYQVRSGEYNRRRQKPAATRRTLGFMYKRLYTHESTHKLISFLLGKSLNLLEYIRKRISISISEKRAKTDHPLHG